MTLYPGKLAAGSEINAVHQGIVLFGGAVLAGRVGTDVSGPGDRAHARGLFPLCPVVRQTI